ncbi:site-specific DNA-methyltransferase [Crocosphaera sp. XPORK-15E]|uniref:DNA-methyltransferase n=1 Tax=Crocosphaera sp. XPORK-15E TaxID=3110247 RepID=UPI002B1F060D|nr:site-specific DNA-methyltransferase [Crocosphaera sp. XPORK-15E]MEA5535080.1 site-specific DNA-methyltransferase [Crocosphaera sp. XPORK-15E]
MTLSHLFFTALGINPKEIKEIKKLSSQTGISVNELKYYDENNIVPSGHNLEKICKIKEINPLYLKLFMGIIDQETIIGIQNNAAQIYNLIKDQIEVTKIRDIKPQLRLTTDYGNLYQGDCLDLMFHTQSDSVDLIFADPPFNLSKIYPSKINDQLIDKDYLSWCETWLKDCIRILKPGGSLFVWNLPKWNTHLSYFLNQYLTFRHWITVDIKYSFPIAGRLYPSHYSLLYYCKGDKPKTFHADRLPLELCSNCYQELRDYGGYKHKLNPQGMNLTDVWYDIPPVRHHKYKNRQGANELSIKLLDRIIEMASDEGDTIFDPFGGAGTTYIVAEMKHRKWLGIEIGPIDDILNRFERIDQEKEYLQKIRDNYNCLFNHKNLQSRINQGLWTPDSVRKQNNQVNNGNKNSLVVQAELDFSLKVDNI